MFSANTRDWLVRVYRPLSWSTVKCSTAYLVESEGALSSRSRRVGRPPLVDGEKLTSVTFKLDAQTLEALERLESGEAKVRGRRSAVLRKIILEASRRTRR